MQVEDIESPSGRMRMRIAGVGASLSTALAMIGGLAEGGTIPTDAARAEVMQATKAAQEQLAALAQELGELALLVDTGLGMLLQDRPN